MLPRRFANNPDPSKEDLSLDTSAGGCPACGQPRRTDLVNICWNCGGDLLDPIMKQGLADSPFWVKAGRFVLLGIIIIGIVDPRTLLAAAGPLVPTLFLWWNLVRRRRAAGKPSEVVANGFRAWGLMGYLLLEGMVVFLLLVVAGVLGAGCFKWLFHWKTIPGYLLERVIPLLAGLPAVLFLGWEFRRLWAEIDEKPK